MTIKGSWSPAFPIRPATDAVEALCESWRVLAEKRREGFHPRTREPVLTRALKTYAERVTAPQRGLLGMWAAESVHNEMNLDTAKLKEERRTDIIYGWNDEQIGFQLVFEFKKLDSSPQSQRQYFGDNGLGRFVTGIYAQGQSIAVMVGILVAPEESVLPLLQKAIADDARVASLRIRLGPGGDALEKPSRLFPARAHFDTEHEREARLLAPDHDTIRVAHIFLAFGYAMS